MVLRIVCIEGPLAGHFFPLDDQSISFGRHPNSTIHIASTAASRHHAELRHERGSYVLRDLGSQNGTLINGERMSTRLIQLGDVFGIGGELFRLEAADDDDTLTPKAQLIYVSGALAGNLFAVGEQSISFGRYADSTVKIPNKLASRHHAALRCEEGGYVLHDLGSA